jgi:hypothetical protein
MEAGLVSRSLQHVLAWWFFLEWCQEIEAELARRYPAHSVYRPRALELITNLKVPTNHALRTAVMNHDISVPDLCAMSAAELASPEVCGKELRACVSVCLSVCLYACMHLCMYVCMSVCTYVHMRAE